MEEKRIVPSWVTAILVILCLAVLSLDIYGICKAESFVLNYAVFAVSTLFALFYCISGYRKRPQLFYRIGIAAFGVSEVVAAVSTFFVLLLSERLDTLGFVSMVIYLVEAIILLSLAFGKDFGRSASFVLAWIVIGLAVVNAVIITLSLGLDYSAGIRFSALVLSAVVYIMVYAKYRDKAARGTT